MKKLLVIMFCLSCSLGHCQEVFQKAEVLIVDEARVAIECMEAMPDEWPLIADKKAMKYIVVWYVVSTELTAGPAPEPDPYRQVSSGDKLPGSLQDYGRGKNKSF